jgi:phosphatidylglycerophosphatase C
MSDGLALFDFDGTITRKDTLLDFMMYVKGLPLSLAVFFRLIPAAVAWKRGKLGNQAFKERFLTLSFRGLSETMLRSRGVEYGRERIPRLLRRGALERLEWHRNQGHRIVIVSASTDVWLSEWCRRQNIELICSELEFVGGSCTGRLKGANCRGPEKVRRIQAEIDTTAYRTVYAYGDSSGDTDMLAFADKKFFRPFHRGSGLQTITGTEG